MEKLFQFTSKWSNIDSGGVESGARRLADAGSCFVAAATAATAL